MSPLRSLGNINSAFDDFYGRTGKDALLPSALPPIDGGGSVSFDGSGDYLFSPSNSAYTFGTDDFTLEAFVYPTANNENKTVFSTDWGANGSILITYSHPSGGGTGDFGFFDHTASAGSAQVTTSSTYAINTWHHVVFVRNGNSHKFYINGVEDGSSTYTANNLTRDVFCIGAVYDSGTETFQGKISNVRVTKGSALYISNFTTPELPLTTTSQGASESDVKLICCQATTDSSSAFYKATPGSNAMAVTVAPGTFSNSNSTYSSGVSSPDGTIASSPNDATALFDGKTTVNCQTTAAGTTVRWTPPATTSWTSSLRVHTGAYSGSVVINSTTVHSNGTQVQAPYWTSASSSSGTISKIDAQGHIGAGVGYMKAIEIDGTMLIDGYTGKTITAEGDPTVSTDNPFS